MTPYLLLIRPGEYALLYLPAAIVAALERAP